MPIYAVFVILWSSALLVLWRQRCSELAYRSVTPSAAVAAWVASNRLRGYSASALLFSSLALFSRCLQPAVFVRAERECPPMFSSIRQPPFPSHKGTIFSKRRTAKNNVLGWSTYFHLPSIAGFSTRR